MVVSNRNLLFQGSIFRGHVSFREGTSWRSSLLSATFTRGQTDKPVVYAGGPMTYHLSSYQTSHFEVAFLRLASPNSWMVHFHIHHDTMKISGCIIISSVNNEIPSVHKPVRLASILLQDAEFSPLVKKWPLSIVVGWNPILKGLYSLNQIQNLDYNKTEAPCFKSFEITYRAEENQIQQLQTEFHFMNFPFIKQETSVFTVTYQLAGRPI